MSGKTVWQSRPLPVMLVNPSPATLPLHWYRLVKQNPSGEIELVTTQGSGDIVSLATSDGFITSHRDRRVQDLGRFMRGKWGA